MITTASFHGFSFQPGGIVAAGGEAGGGGGGVLTLVAVLPVVHLLSIACLDILSRMPFLEVRSVIQSCCQGRRRLKKGTLLRSEL